jgi:hypothetical protein
MPTCSGSHAMALTRRQRELLKEVEAIAALTKLDYYKIEEADPEARIPLLKIAINNMVIAQVVTCYTLLDEILSDIIARYFFKVPKKQLHFGKLWRTKKFQTFNHHILDEMYFLKKMELVHAMTRYRAKSLRPSARSTRYGMPLHTVFFPENRKEHRKSKKVLYTGKDIHTRDGLELFLNDWHPAWDYLARRAFGRWHDE